ncbi:MAG: peptidoglycan DD-metalloendopeptidase family protein [Coriobacteriia bacterium]|nr:peptidoglycan DD-metalloendopeptidase family protein [Coriobacteriia bacterium]
MFKPTMQAFRTKIFSERTGLSYRRLIVYTIFVSVFFAAISTGPFASAAYGAYGARSLTIVREFGALYGVENKQHSGMDVRTEVGETILSPVPGVVSFVGRVPGSVAGLGIVAVTVKTQEGHLVTLSPLAGTGVEAGDVLSKGDTVGVVAAAGDPSSSSTHVHISMRVAGKYVDPASLVSAVLSRETVKSASDDEAPAQVKVTESASAVAPAFGHVEAAAAGVPQVKSNGTVPSTESQVELSAHMSSDALSSVMDSHGEVSVAHAILLEEEKAGVTASALLGAAGPKSVDSVKVIRVHDGIMVPSLSTGQLAVCIFLIGLSLTFAGVRVVKVIDEKFDLIGKFERLAVRAHR